MLSEAVAFFLLSLFIALVFFSIGFRAIVGLWPWDKRAWWDDDKW